MRSLRIKEGKKPCATFKLSKQPEVSYNTCIINVLAKFNYLERRGPPILVVLFIFKIN